MCASKYNNKIANSPAAGVAYACMHVRTHTHTCTQTYKNIYVCMYICICKSIYGQHECALNNSRKSIYTIKRTHFTLPFCMHFNFSFQFQFTHNAILTGTFYARQNLGGKQQLTKVGCSKSDSDIDCCSVAKFG